VVEYGVKSKVVRAENSRSNLQFAGDSRVPDSTHMENHVYVRYVYMRYWDITYGICIYGAGTYIVYLTI
jgi:hypothetical protein